MLYIRPRSESDNEKLKLNFKFLHPNFERLPDSRGISLWKPWSRTGKKFKEENLDQKKSPSFQVEKEKVLKHHVIDDKYLLNDIMLLHAIKCYYMLLNVTNNI